MIYRNVVKRIFDIVLSLLALPFFGLLVLIFGLMIKLDDGGPIFYNADRVGQGRKLYLMYKFRTMKVNAPSLFMDDGTAFNAPDDPRQTKVGIFLRKYSLDELPQILNVLKGNMSLIGPRPDLESQVALYAPGEERKLEIKPGLSGHAQVNGRNSIPKSERIALDIYYVDHVSFGLDLKIFFQTIAMIFSSHGVYTEETTPEELARAAEQGMNVRADARAAEEKMDGAAK